jgi:hypothetical protein
MGFSVTLPALIDDWGIIVATGTNGGGVAPMSLATIRVMAHFSPKTRCSAD